MKIVRIPALALTVFVLIGAALLITALAM